MVYRRQILSTALIALSGCLTDRASRLDESSRSPSGSSQLTRSRRPRSTRVTVGSVEYDLWYLDSADYLRYYDPERDELDRLYPDGDLWVSAPVRVSNLSDEPIDPPELSRFSLFSDDSSVSSLRDFPIDRDLLRLRESNSLSFDEPGYGSMRAPQEIRGGSELTVNLLFDAPSGDDLAIMIGGVDQLLRPDQPF